MASASARVSGRAMARVNDWAMARVSGRLWLGPSNHGWQRHDQLMVQICQSSKYIYEHVRLSDYCVCVV